MATEQKNDFFVRSQATPSGLGSIPFSWPEPPGLAKNPTHSEISAPRWDSTISANMPPGKPGMMLFTIRLPRSLFSSTLSPNKTSQNYLSRFYSNQTHRSGTAPVINEHRSRQPRLPILRNSRRSRSTRRIRLAHPSHRTHRDGCDYH